VGCHGGSGLDVWGIDTLVNYPPGELHLAVVTLLSQHPPLSDCPATHLPL
jgi:hypothetical protein